MWHRKRASRQTAPSWPSGEREGGPRVLVEHPDPAAQDVLARRLRERGYEVVTCGGPRAAGGTEVSCPLLRQEPCNAARGADVVVSGLSLRSSPERMIIRRLAHDAHAGTLLIEGTPGDAEGLVGLDEVAGFVAPLTVDTVLEALEELEDVTA